MQTTNRENGFLRGCGVFGGGWGVLEISLISILAESFKNSSAIQSLHSAMFWTFVAISKSVENIQCTYTNP